SGPCPARILCSPSGLISTAAFSISMRTVSGMTFPLGVWVLIVIVIVIVILIGAGRPITITITIRMVGPSPVGQYLPPDPPTHQQSGRSHDGPRVDRRDHQAIKWRRHAPEVVLPGVPVQPAVG